MNAPARSFAGSPACEVKTPAVSPRDTLVSRAHDSGALLEAVLTAPGLAHLIARRSYWHSNGFAKLVLAEDTATGIRVRLHAWLDPTAAVEEPNIHNHRWEFASVVLGGSGLEVRDFQVDRSGTSHHAFAYRRPSAGPSVLEPLGSAELLESSCSVVGPGTVYTCGTDEFHRTRPVPGRQLFTLIAQGNTVLPFATVYSRTRTPRQVAEPDNLLSVDEVRTLVRGALNSLAMSRAL